MVPKDIDVRNHLGMVAPRECDLARKHPGGEDDNVEALEVVGAHPRAELRLDASLGQELVEVPYGLVELLLAGDALGHVELPPDLPSLVKQGHVVPAHRALGRHGEARGARAHHGDPLSLLCRSTEELGLVACVGVDEARRPNPLKGMVEAGLVAPDAAVDLIRPSFHGLEHKVGVREKRPRHRHHVRLPPRDDAVRDLGGVDAVGGAEGDPHEGAELLSHPGEASPGDARRDGRDARLVPADARVDDGDARGLEGPGELHDLVPCGALVEEVKHAEAEDDDKVVANLLAHALDNGKGESDAVLVGPPPLVGAPVCVLGDKLIDQVPLRTHHLDAVVTCISRELGAHRIVLDRLKHLRAGELLGLEGPNGRLEGRGRHGEGVVGVPPRVEDLHAYLGTGPHLVHRPRDLSVRVHIKSR
mmetsp:Transcript_21303/g.53689  ORF Transcript_21303/g.53689 Transcript_21303/m.53689 type:complete len:418 (-) Transcript_21303:355-1608(-)